MNRLFLLLFGAVTLFAHARVLGFVPNKEVSVLQSLGLPDSGCTDPTACNYAEEANEDDGSCFYPNYGYDCDGNCLGATRWFIDASADASISDGSEDLPFSTVQAGIDAACSGDTILIAPGLYVENINLTTANIVLSGFAPEIAIDEVAENVILDGNELGTTLFVSGENSTISHLTVQNGKSGFGAGLYLLGAHYSTVNNCIIRDNIGTGDITAHGIALNANNCLIEECLVTGNYGRKHTVNTGGNDNVIRNCRIIDNNAWETGGGIVVYTNRMLIQNCLISNNNGGGITTYKDNTVVDHCTVTGNSGFGFFIWCYSNDADFWITNSISSNNGNQEFTIAQSGNLVGTAHLRNTLVEGGVDYDWLSIYKLFDVDSTLIELPPMLLENLSLSSVSPAIGSGTEWRYGFNGEQTTFSVDFDLEGAMRPIPEGSSPDLGCFEHPLGAGEPTPGCTDNSACNFNVSATEDDGTCIAPSCLDVMACNYDPEGICDGGECIPSGCLEPEACNYNPDAQCEGENCNYTCCPGPGCCSVGLTWDFQLETCILDSSSDSTIFASVCGPGTYWDELELNCLPIEICEEDLDGDGVVGVNDLMHLLSHFGTNCN